MKLKILILILFFFLIKEYLFADEGFWLLPFGSKSGQTIGNTGKLQFSDKDLFDINKASIKDAIAYFGEATGVAISENGLILTCKHVGYSYIAKITDTKFKKENDGYWALSQEDEIPILNSKISFLRRIENVTLRILPHITGIFSVHKILN